MFGVSRLIGRESIWLGLGVAGFVASVGLQAAQSPVPEDHSGYFGGWTLNRELSSTPPTPDRPDGRGREGGGGRGRGGPPGGGFGGPGGGGGFGPPGGGGAQRGSPSFDPKEMEKTMALMQELLTPTAHWIITSADDGTIVFSDAEGRSSRYIPNDKKEKHQLTDGTIETKTKWDNGQLRQEISLSNGMKSVRVFAVKPQDKQLTVTTTMEGGPGGRRPPFRLVYDRDENR
jgi:hypothetical protein